MGAAYTTTNSFFFFLPPLATHHLLEGVGRFYGGVNYPSVKARPAYGPIKGVAVVYVEQVVAGATVGRVVVVGVVLGADVVVAALGVDVIFYPVADLLEEHLVASGGVAGVAIALDHSHDDLLGQGRATTNQRHEHHHRHGYHHRYLLLGMHLFLLPEEGTLLALMCAPPLGLTDSLTHHIISSIRGAAHPPHTHPLRALFTRVRRRGILRSSVAGTCIEN